MYDPHFTPADVASRVAAFLPAETGSVLDPTAGEGSLLAAAERRFGDSCRYLGLDIDIEVVRRMRRLHPTWGISSGNLLNSNSVERTHVFDEACGTRPTALLVNPPFRRTAVLESLPDSPTAAYRVEPSPALRFLLSAVQTFKPTSAICGVLPEGLFTSTRDTYARSLLLNQGWTLSHSEPLPRNTFRGVFPNTRIAIFVTDADRKTQASATAKKRKRRVLHQSRLEIVRGGLPLHAARFSRRGVPFLHSVNISTMPTSSATRKLRRVKSITRGIVDGHVVLLPRVGVPTLEHLTALELRVPVQLSDCVIALRVGTPADSTRLASFLGARVGELRSLYSGTGARFVTVDRLRTWLASRGWSAVPA